MTLHQILVVTHLIGAILWVGGGVVAGLIAVRLLAGPAEGREQAVSAVRAVALRVVAPGLVIAWVCGLTLFITEIATYRSAGWLHAKITVALVVAGLSGVLSGRLRKAAQSGEGAGTIQTLSWLILAGALAVVFLVIVAPF